MNYIIQCIFGFLGGIFGGMGMGGGTLLIPLLVIFCGMDQYLCQGINLLSFLIMAIISMFIHTKNNLIEFNVVLPLVFGGVCFSVLGSFLAGLLPSKILKILFGIFLCFLGVYQLFRLFTYKQKE